LGVQLQFSNSEFPISTLPFRRIHTAAALSSQTQNVIPLWGGIAVPFGRSVNSLGLLTASKPPLLLNTYPHWLANERPRRFSQRMAMPVGKSEVWSALSPLGDCAWITANSEEILPLSEQWGANGSDNALFVEVQPADSPEVLKSRSRKLGRRIGRIVASLDRNVTRCPLSADRLRRVRTGLRFWTGKQCCRRETPQRME